MNLWGSRWETVAGLGRGSSRNYRGQGLYPTMLLSALPLVPYYDTIVAGASIALSLMTLRQSLRRSPKDRRSLRIAMRWYKDIKCRDRAHSFFLFFEAIERASFPA